MTQSTSHTAPVYGAIRVARLLDDLELARAQVFGDPPMPYEGFVTFFDAGWNILRLREVVADKHIVYLQN